MQLKDLGYEYQESATKSGIKVVNLYSPGKPFSLRATFHSGSRFDPEGKRGLAHFVEHLITAGTERFPTKDKLAAYIERYGGVFGAYTSSEVMGVNVNVGDPSDVKVAVEVLNEMLCHSLMDHDVAENERGSVLRELGNWESTPARFVWEVWRDVVWRGTPLQGGILGTAESIKASTMDDVKRFFRNRLDGRRLVLVAAGGVEIDWLIAALDDMLELEAGTEPASYPPLELADTPDIKGRRYKVNDQIDFILGFPTVPLGHPDGAALDLLAELVGGGRASTLSRVLRGENGLVYTVFADSSGFSDAGYWAVKTATAVGDLDKTLGLIRRELERLKDGLDDDELAFCKDKLVKSQRLQMQSVQSWVDFHAAPALFFAEPYDLSDYVASIKRVTLHDAREAADRYLDYGRMQLAMCGDIDPDSIDLGY